MTDLSEIKARMETRRTISEREEARITQLEEALRIALEGLDVTWVDKNRERAIKSRQALSQSPSDWLTQHDAEKDARIAQLEEALKTATERVDPIWANNHRVYAREIRGILSQSPSTWLVQHDAEIRRQEAERLSNDDAMLEIARKAIEDTLIEWRDSRLFELARNNGLVVREANGDKSSLIRFGPETAMRIGLKAIASAIRSRHEVTS